MLDAAFQYAPRHPETTVLYQVVAEQLETFLARRQERDRPVPRFVEKEFRSLGSATIYGEQLRETRSGSRRAGDFLHIISALRVNRAKPTHPRRASCAAVWKV